MNYSTETIYHFSCMGCDLWWSIAGENISIEKNTWACPWCGHEHKPPHRDVSHYFGETQSQRQVG